MDANSLKEAKSVAEKPTSRSGISHTNQIRNTRLKSSRSGEITIFLSIDQIVGICNDEDLWAFQNGKLVDPELISKGNGKIILTRALVGG